MTILKAAILGLIQGLTEFLPISSSGHLAVFARNMEESGLALIVVLHVGTLLSIFVYFRKDISTAFAGGVRLTGAAGRALAGREKLSAFLAKDAGARLALLVVVGSIPTGIIGLALKPLAEFAVSPENVRIIGAFFIVTGFLMYKCDSFPLGGKTLSQGWLRDAVAVGVFQGIAVLPGLSRSGLTVFAAVARGFDRQDAARFSFLMSIPALCAAAALELHGQNVHLPVTPTLVGIAVAAVSGYLGLAILVRVLTTRKLRYFTSYLIAMGLLVLAFCG